MLYEIASSSAMVISVPSAIGITKLDIRERGELEIRRLVPGTTVSTGQGHGAPVAPGSSSGTN